MLRISLFAAVLLIAMRPYGAAACDVMEHGECESDLRDLIAARLLAMENAFGESFETLAPQMTIRIAKRSDSLHEAQATYDPEHRTLTVPRTYLVAMQAPIPLEWARSYWPYYRQFEYRDEFAVIGAIDSLLWDAYLQEAARVRGASWPDKACFSNELRRRLPCEMLVAGIAEHVQSVRLPLFNVNRLDLIWPDDLSSFERALSGARDSRYLEVRRYGGILLLKPLIAEFGVPRVLAYVAGNPFKVHGDNLRQAALRYQSEARASLRNADYTPAPTPRALGTRSTPGSF